jgi:hypothetical protein
MPRSSSAVGGLSEIQTLDGNNEKNGSSGVAAALAGWNVPVLPSRPGLEAHAMEPSKDGEPAKSCCMLMELVMQPNRTIVAHLLNVNE